jgi:hypothetical protein
VNSVCRNVAEGFGCESHVEFARFLKISRRARAIRAEVGRLQRPFRRLSSTRARAIW